MSIYCLCGCVQGFYRKDMFIVGAIHVIDSRASVAVYFA